VFTNHYSFMESPSTTIQNSIDNIKQSIERVQTYFSPQTALVVYDQFRTNTKPLLQHTLKFLKNTPYIISFYLLIIIIDLQPQLMEQETTSTLGDAFSIAILIMIANAFLFTEAYNYFTTGEQINSVPIRALKRTPYLLGTTILYVVMTTVGFLIFIVPGIILSVKYILAQPASVISEEPSFRASFSKSADATTQKRTFLYLILGITALPILPLLTTMIVISEPYSLIITIIFFTCYAPFAQAFLAVLYLSAQNDTTIKPIHSSKDYNLLRSLE